MDKTVFLKFITSKRKKISRNKRMLLLLLSHFSHVRLCATPKTAAHQALSPWDSPGKSTGVGCHCLLPYLFTSRPKSLTSSHLWDANDHPPLPGRRGEKTLTTGGPGKEQGTDKLPPTRILQRSTRGQPEMGDCSPEVLATSSEQQRPSIVKTNSMLPKTNK